MSDTCPNCDNEYIESDVVSSLGVSSDVQTLILESDELDDGIDTAPVICVTPHGHKTIIIYKHTYDQITS